jgi:hypothetical protein
LFSLFFQAQFRVGYDINERGFDFAFTHSSCTYTGAHPRTSEHLSSHFTVHIQRLLHAFLGRERRIAAPRIAVSDTESARADAYLAEHGLGGGLLVVAPGGSTPTKLWPMERFPARRSSETASRPSSCSAPRKPTRNVTSRTCRAGFGSMRAATRSARTSRW